jgi:gamma-D-glutamyl-L-lysine dipeptidyl-peptidase
MELSFGVCRLSVVSVRREHHLHAQQVSQLLFGDHYEVLATSSNKIWQQIRIYFDQTEGWIETKHHHAITPEYFDQINSADFKTTTDVCSTILYKKTPLSIVIGSIVPISQSELFKMEEQFAFNGESKPVGQKREFEFIKAIAVKYLNAPEQVGGKTPFGISGNALVQMAYKIGGYSLPFFAEQQARCGKKVGDLISIRAGDVAFFRLRDDKELRSGLVLADGKILHVDGKAKIDQLVEDGILDVETKIVTHQLDSVRRILTD